MTFHITKQVATRNNSVRLCPTPELTASRAPAENTLKFILNKNVNYKSIDAEIANLVDSNL